MSAIEQLEDARILIEKLEVKESIGILDETQEAEGLNLHWLRK